MLVNFPVNLKSETPIVWGFHNTWEDDGNRTHGPQNHKLML